MNEITRFHQPDGEPDRADRTIAALADLTTVGPPDDAVVLRARRDLLRHAGTARSSRKTAVRTAFARFRRRVPRPLLITAAVAATVAVVTAVPFALTGDTTRHSPAGKAQGQVQPTPTPTRPADLTSAKAAYDWIATRLESADYPDWQGAQYWYVRSSGPTGASSTREVWIGHRAPGRIVFAGRSLDQPAARFGLEHTDTKTVDWDGLWSLPTDPATLEQTLRSGFARPEGAQADAELWTVTNALLIDSPAPVALRAAMFRMLGTLPGLTVREISGTTGPLSIAITRQDDDYLTRYTYDVDTGGLLRSTVGDITTTYRVMGWTPSPREAPKPQDQLAIPQSQGG